MVIIGESVSFLDFLFLRLDEISDILATSLSDVAFLGRFLLAFFEVWILLTISREVELLRNNLFFGFGNS